MNHPQIPYALERLNAALASTGAKATTREADLKPGDFLVALANDASQAAAESGSYVIRTRPDGTHLVLGRDATGALYGCLHAARLAADGQASFDVSESPAFRYRGVEVPLQLMELIYDGVFYDFPITRENFPFFYDQALWTRVLDMLVENRMNVIYLWNGHPFTSLLPMDKYPDAREVSPEQLEQNMAMYGWLTREAEKRGIWVVQLFYNIHISHPLAKKMGIPFQGAGITPFTKEYTRYCIGEFVKTYPHVGLLMTLGEAMAESDGPEWLNETILPGVKDGMAAAGLTEEPPVIVRAHATRIVEAITRAKTHYSNILTMHKWNGESLTWDNVRGPVRDMHSKLATLGGGHVINVHLLSNLEPFRWGSPAFIRSTMTHAREIGASGLHLYPLYNWAWPYSGDKTEPRLLQLDRDWIWYAAWARYAWNPQRDEADERVWWSREIASRFGSVSAGEAILDAYEQAGPCQPMLLRRFGITGGGRQSLPLGMLMTQLINPKRFSEWILLYLGDGPEGERLAEWAEKEFHGREHIGETPPQVIEEVEDRIEKANAAIAAARPGVTANHEEFERLARDMICLRELVKFYTCRVRAGMRVLRYRHSSDLEDLKAALPLVEQSMVHFRRLVEIGNEAYTTVPSQMTIGRRIPFQYTKETPYAHWHDCLPDYEKELENFRINLAQLAAGHNPLAIRQKREPYPQAPFRLVSGEAEEFTLADGERLFIDRPEEIRNLADELRGLRGIRIRAAGCEGGRPVEIETDKPVQILVAFFDNECHAVTRVIRPEWEWDPILGRALSFGDWGTLSVANHQLPAGRSKIDFGGGAYLIAGFVPDGVPLVSREANPDENSGNPIDWLFE